MTSTHWERLNSVFQDVLALPVNERADFVSRVCGRGGMGAQATVRRLP